jgi:hypothetical protein
MTISRWLQFGAITGWFIVASGYFYPHPATGIALAALLAWILSIMLEK